MSLQEIQLKPLTWLAACTTLLLALVSSPARSQPAELGVGQKRPWAQGVPQVNQAAANSHFLEGNVQLENGLFAKAIEKYEQALALWSHPSIHYNMALALVSLREPLKLHKHLTEALRYDGQPLDNNKVGRARDLLKLVEGQLVRLKVSCDVAGASVRMNGKELFVGPGAYEEWVLPDDYTFTAVKEGYPLNERKRVPTAGEELVLDYKLYTMDEMTRGKRLWPAWRSWAVVGLGAAVAGGGYFFRQQAVGTYRQFDDAVANCSRDNPSLGCPSSTELLDQQSRGDVSNKRAVSAFAVGGAVAATGLVLVYVNRLQTDVLSPDEHEKSLQVVPVLGAGQGGVVATLRF
jgi:tetratricopeptide (TPR) repeat protein